MKLVLCIFVLVASLTGIIVMNLLTTSSSVVECQSQHFYLPNMEGCHKWLDCPDLKHITVKELIGVGGVKAVYRAVWKKWNVSISFLNNPDMRDDFNHGLKMLKMLNPSPYVVQLIGFCLSKNVILTEYHPFGNAVNITNILRKKNNSDSVRDRLKLCLNYALLLEYLHSGPAGCRVMCDTNTLEKTLSQLLVTSDMTLLLNDVDALPKVNDKQSGIYCGRQSLRGTFIAPEQNSVSFNSMGYNEKTDIWKAASVCDHFIGNVSYSDTLRYKLFFVHKKCKSVDAHKRPSATQLAAQYIKIMHELDGEL